MKKPDADMVGRLDQYFDEIGVRDKEKALASIQSQKVDETNKIRRLTTIYHNIGKLLSNYFHFQAEYGYWKESLLSPQCGTGNEKMSTNSSGREETVRDLNSAQQLLKSQK